MPWETIVGLAVTVPLLVAFFAFRLRASAAERRRRRRAEEYAQSAGWSYAYTQPALAADYFGVPPFTSGSRAQFDDVIFHTSGHNQGHSFDFSFGVGTSSREYRHYQHVISLMLPGGLPAMSLRPQYATDSLGIALGLQDIEFESDDFNAAWLVRGVSAVAVHDILHPRAMAWLMEPRNLGVTFGISGWYLFMCIPGQQQSERIPEAANRLIEFAHLIPPFVWDKARGVC